MREQRAAPMEYTYIYTSIIRLLCSYYEFSLGHWPWSPHAGRSLYLTHIYILLIMYNAIVGTILYYYYYAYEYNNTLVYTSTQCDGVGFYFPISPHAYTNTHTYARVCSYVRGRQCLRNAFSFFTLFLGISFRLLLHDSVYITNTCLYILILRVCLLV